jgi:hypothetical protein
MRGVIWRLSAKFGLIPFSNGFFKPGKSPGRSSIGGSRTHIPSRSRCTKRDLADST